MKLASESSNVDYKTKYSCLLSYIYFTWHNLANIDRQRHHACYTGCFKEAAPGFGFFLLASLLYITTSMPLHIYCAFEDSVENHFKIREKKMKWMIVKSVWGADRTDTETVGAISDTYPYVHCVGEWAEPNVEERRMFFVFFNVWETSHSNICNSTK